MGEIGIRVFLRFKVMITRVLILLDIVHYVTQVAYFSQHKHTYLGVRICFFNFCFVLGHAVGSSSFFFGLKLCLSVFLPKRGTLNMIKSLRFFRVHTDWEYTTCYF